MMEEEYWAVLQELDDFKSDLSKLIKDVLENAPSQSDNLLDHAIQKGRVEVVRRIEKLLRERK